MTFLDNLEDKLNVGYTQNDAKAYNTTKSDVLDLFSKIGVMRESSKKEIEDSFITSFYEDKLLTTKLMFYARDIRGGLGERRTIRIMLNYLAKNYPEIIEKNIHLIPEYGRWDDLLSLFYTPCESLAIDLIKKQLHIDLKNGKENKSVSLLGKWLPSANASSLSTKRLAKKIIKSLGLTEREYRKTLTFLREKINIVETKMSSNTWNEIEYSTVPSKAMKQYRNAFDRHDSNFATFLENVKKGKQKINTSTLTPFDIFNSFGINDTYHSGIELKKQDDTLEQLWDNLPDYVPKDLNVLVMADTSGSMKFNDRGRPFVVSLALATYFAERNTGPYYNKYMVFSKEPRLITLKGNNIYEKVRSFEAIHPKNTDFEKALNVILDTAIDNELSQEELPSSLVTISDMQFDQARAGNDEYFMKNMEEKYGDYGYDLPNMVFWNVYSGSNIVHATKDKSGVQLVSGYSPTVFKDFISQNILGKTPYEAMLEVLNKERYAKVTI